VKVIHAENLSLHYGNNESALHNLTLSVEAGEFFVVIGPNGSGKTTLLNILSRYLRPTGGTIEILDRPLAEYSQRQLAQKVAVVPQQMPVDFPFTVEETVLMGRSPHLGLTAVEGERDRAIAREAMVFTDVAHLAKRGLDQLSGGERQRVIIARALCQEPAIILLDEPTAALDPAHQLHIMDLMERLRAEKGSTIVMVSHDLNLAALYGQRLLLLKDGKSMAEGRPGEVLTEELLLHCYGCVMKVERNTFSQTPRITPVPDRFLEKDKNKATGP